jgi:signal transduction histidine kinase
MLNATAGKFLGNAALPEPIRPSWDQVLNGSLDAEYVELRGALTEIEPSRMTLLTSEGKIQIGTIEDHSLPYLPELLNGQTYVDSIVRIRGCFTANWDFPARQVKPGEIYLTPGTVEVEEFAPRNPFDLPCKRVADLLLFDPNATILRRTKVKGQIVLAAEGDYRLQDGSAGLRFRTKEPLALKAGDMVEAVGFVQVSGPCPSLQEARVQKIGTAALPVPVAIAGAELRNNGHDSTRVQVEAVLLNDRAEMGFRTLEMQAGQYHFNARLKQARTKAPPLPVGCRLELTGVYLSAPDEKVGGNPDAFELWLDNPADIRVLAQPPWWTLRRALAIVAALSAVLGIAAVWITLLRRQVEERTIQLRKEVEERHLVEHRRVIEQERTRVAQDLHDELGAGLTEVGLLGDLVKNPIVPEPEKLQYLGQLTEIARSLVTSLDVIVWAINPCYDSVASLASYYTLFAQRFLNLAGIACRPQIPADFPDYPLDPKARHGLFLAFKEALNNVVRHSGATETRLKIEVREDNLVVFLADNGCGIRFSPEAPGQEGLQGMRRRMMQLGGHCDIRSRPGEGTEVELRIPVGHLVL